MKPVRTIEKLAYGEGTPDGLADLVPSWDELDLPRSYRGWDSMGIHGSGLSIRDTRDGRWYMTAPDALSARWFAACLIAHKAGCPPHWVDMGFKAASLGDRWLYKQGKIVLVSAVKSAGGPWAVYDCTVFDVNAPVVGCLNEMEARLKAAEIVVVAS